MSRLVSILRRTPLALRDNGRIETGGLLDILAHPNQAKYPRQRILVVAADNHGSTCKRVKPMPKIDAYEEEVLVAFEKGKLNSVATRAEPAKFKAAARATAIKDRRVNIPLSSGDLSDIQVKALEEGVPYQTLIASVLHKYVTGRLAERPARSSRR
jgi:predicted DNA binding CopG/RHH family protein